MSDHDLDHNRMESLSILLYEEIVKKDNQGKFAMLIDIQNRFPVGLTDEEFNTVIAGLEGAEYIRFEPGTGVRSRFLPGPRLMIS